MRRITTAVMGLMATTAALANEPAVPYPEGYRAWYHVKSMVIEPGHALYEAFGGIHHLYANRKALQGYASGRFPDGAVIVFDLLQTQAADGAVTEGARKVVGVMHKDSKRWPRTGGWGFEGFKGGSKQDRVVGANAAEACFQCHTVQRDRDFVFSSLRE